MPAVAPYIPPKDPALNNWLNNFTTLISANPAMYGLAPSDASNIAAAVSTWSAAYMPVTSPMTKTASAVRTRTPQKSPRSRSFVLIRR